MKKMIRPGLCLLATAWLVVFGLLSLPPAAGAGEAAGLTATIKDRGVFMEYKFVPDSQRHVLALTQREGEAKFSNGQSAKYQAYSLIDAWVGKKGFRRGYSILEFSDGSKIFYAWRADSKRNQENLPSLKGSGNITGGSGRFEGIKGTVVFSGVQDRPSREDPSRARTTRAEFTYTLP